MKYFPYLRGFFEKEIKNIFGKRLEVSGIIQIFTYVDARNDSDIKNVLKNIEKIIHHQTSVERMVIGRLWSLNKLRK